MTSPPAGDDWFTLDELDDRLGQLVWVETAMADLLDQWSRIEPFDSVAIHLAATAEHHRWHAEVLDRCRPVAAKAEGDRDTDASRRLRPGRPPTDGWHVAVDRLSSLDEAERAGLRLSVLVRQLDPWLARETGALLACARPIADASLMRWLRFIEIDHRDDGEVSAQHFDQQDSNLVELRDHAFLGAIDLTTK